MLTKVARREAFDWKGSALFDEFHPTLGAITGFVLYDFGVHGTSVFSGRSGLVGLIVLFAAGEGEGGNSERGDPNRNPEASHGCVHWVTFNCFG